MGIAGAKGSGQPGTGVVGADPGERVTQHTPVQLSLGTDSLILGIGPPGSKSVVMVDRNGERRPLNEQGILKAARRIADEYLDKGPCAAGDVYQDALNRLEKAMGWQLDSVAAHVALERG